MDIYLVTQASMDDLDADDVLEKLISAPIVYPMCYQAINVAMHNWMAHHLDRGEQAPSVELQQSTDHEGNECWQATAEDGFVIRVTKQTL